MRLSLFAAAAALLSASLAAHADILTTFTVTGTFPDSTLAGTITIDTTTGSATAIDVSLSSPEATTFTTISSQVPAYGGANEYEINTIAGNEELQLLLNSASLIGYTGGSLTTPPYDSDLEVNGQFYEDLTSGQVTVPTSVTPEPSSIALLGTGLLGVAGVVRKRFA